MADLCGRTLALFAASFLLPSRLIPVIYLLRGILLVPATALVYFALPARHVFRTLRTAIWKDWSRLESH